MDLVNINSSGSVDHGPQRAGQPDHAKLVPQKPPVNHDTATISEDSRESLRHVSRLTDKLFEADPEREQKVADAAARLAEGKLDSDHVYRAAADAILGSE